LADDLHHFLTDEPIQARPISAGERALKWARRRPTLAALLGVSAAAAAALLGGGIWSYNALALSAQSERARAVEAEHAKQQAEDALVLGRRRLIRLNVATGSQLVDHGAFQGSLPWLVE